jgi:hypothetical protein
LTSFFSNAHPIKLSTFNQAEPVPTGLTVGKQYKLSFYQASAQQKEFDGDSTDYFTVSFGSSTQNSATMFHASKAPVSAWSEQIMSFTAEDSSQLLSFVAQGAPAGQPPFALLSGVSVEEVQAVPWETDTLPLVGSTVLFGLGLWAKQKLAQKKLK